MYYMIFPDNVHKGNRKMMAKYCIIFKCNNKGAVLMSEVSIDLLTEFSVPILTEFSVPMLTEFSVPILTEFSVLILTEFSVLMLI